MAYDEALIPNNSFSEGPTRTAHVDRQLRSFRLPSSTWGCSLVRWGAALAKQFNQPTFNQSTSTNFDQLQPNSTNQLTHLNQLQPINLNQLEPTSTNQPTLTNQLSHQLQATWTHQGRRRERLHGSLPPGRLHQLRPGAAAPPGGPGGGGSAATAVPSEPAGAPGAGAEAVEEFEVSGGSNWDAFFFKKNVLIFFLMVMNGYSWCIFLMVIDGE